MSPIEVAHSLPTGAAVATVAAEGNDLGSAVRAWAIDRGLTDHYAVDAGGRRYVLRLTSAKLTKPRDSKPPSLQKTQGDSSSMEATCASLPSFGMSLVSMLLRSLG